VCYEATNIRPALIQDARSIAEVHVESWKTTYRGILPESLLSSLSIEKREQFWRDLLTSPQPNSITLVGCDASGRVVGFVSGGSERTGKLGCDGELYAVYLLQTAQRRGLGTLLVRRFVSELSERGFASMAVWVLALNPSRKFYEALGGEVIREQPIESGGESFQEIAYGWRDLSRFGG
jgi:ribosomal protein S18 acetylase RimI-like enzyme